MVFLIKYFLSFNVLMFPTGCTSCGCNVAGSMNAVCNKTNGQCPCKAHSLGHQCDTCPSGFYGLSVNNSEGCLKCQCSNKSSSCVSDRGWFVSQIATNLSVFFFIDVDNWTVISSAGNVIDPELDWSVSPSITLK